MFIIGAPDTDVGTMQELLDAGFSRNKVASMLKIHHSSVDRLVRRGVLELYRPFDEDIDKKHLYQNFEWLWEEDVLEECCNRAFDNYFVSLNEALEGNFEDIGIYVREEYGNIFKYLKCKGAIPLQQYFHKRCTKCGKMYQIMELCSKRNSLFGIDSWCRICNYRATKHNYITNKQYRLSVKISGQNSRSKRRHLPGSYRKVDVIKVLHHFKDGCALTGAIDVDIDHVIPIATGHVGTIPGNIIPLAKTLNRSKKDRNIFEWFEANRQRFELSRERFDRLIEWLASANAMTVDEYREFVYWCHGNPRSIDEIRADSRTSPEIWRESKRVKEVLA